MSAEKHYVRTQAPQLRKGQRLCRAVRDVVLLSIIEWEPLYGAELAVEYERTTGEWVNALYSSIVSLRNRGLIVSVGSTTNAGNYCLRHKLTPKGRTLLAQFRRFIVGV